MMNEFSSVTLFSLMINYFIHSTLFIVAILLAMRLKAIRYDFIGEWLLKSALILGMFTALIQTGGWLQSVNLSEKTDAFWNFQLGATTQSNEVDTAIKNVNLGHDELKQPGLSVTPASPAQSISETVIPASMSTESSVSVDSYRLSVVNLVMIFWLLTSSALVLRHRDQKQQLQHLLSAREHVASDEINVQFKQLLKTAKINKDIQLTQCKHLESPVALTNEVVLPTEFIANRNNAHIEAALAHELAHIKRKDTIWLALSQKLQIFTFFQPLNKLLIQQIHQMVEHRADGLAAQWTENHGALAETLAAHLINHDEVNASFIPTQMVPAMTSKKSNLLLRIEHLMNQQQARTQRYWPLIVAVLMASILLLSPGVIAQITLADSDGQKSSNHHSQISRHIDVEGGKTDMSVSYSDDQRSIKLKAKLNGELRFNDDETDIIDFPAKSRFDLKVDNGDIEKRLLVKSKQGSPSYKYYEDGEEQDYDQSARAWFASVIPDVLRATGLAASSRVKRIQNAYGDAAVLDEIELINSDWVRKSYFKYLFKISELQQNDLQRAMKLAADIKSDFELSHVLTQMVNTQAVDSEDAWLQMLDSAASLQSDFEMAKTLTVFQDHLPSSESINQAYFAAASSIQSDFEMSKVLINYVEQQQANTVNLLHLFELATEIQSDFELAKLLMALNKQMDQADNEVFSAYLDLAISIQSDFEMKKVFSHLLDHDIAENHLSQMIKSASAQINSDFELSKLLVEILDHSQTTDQIRQQVKDASENNIGSRFERERVLSNLM